MVSLSAISAAPIICSSHAPKEGGGGGGGTNRGKTVMGHVHALVTEIV